MSSTSFGTARPQRLAKETDGIGPAKSCLFSGAPDVPCELRERERNAAEFQFPPHLVQTESCLTRMSYLPDAEDRWVLADIVGTRRSRDFGYNKFKLLLPQTENVRIGNQLLLRLV